MDGFTPFAGMMNFLMTGAPRGTLYIGVTNDLIRRVWEHRTKAVDGFTSKYNVTRLVYFEEFGDAISAITREKQMKKWRRAWKIALIEQANPDWSDLYTGLAG
jgi:putative endonuclease